jgi:hypothetical protein
VRFTFFLHQKSVSAFAFERLLIVYLSMMSMEDRDEMFAGMKEKKLDRFLIIQLFREHSK